MTKFKNFGSLTSDDLVFSNVSVTEYDVGTVAGFLNAALTLDHFLPSLRPMVFSSRVSMRGHLAPDPRPLWISPIMSMWRPAIHRLLRALIPSM